MARKTSDKMIRMAVKAGHLVPRGDGSYAKGKGHESKTYAQIMSSHK